MTNKIIYPLVIIALLVAVYGAFRKPTIVESPSGALASNAIDGRDFYIGGAHYYSASIPMIKASTTCAIPLANASSTLVKLAITGARSDSTGDTTYDVSYSSNKYSTSSTASDNFTVGATWASATKIEFATAGTSTTVVPPTSKFLLLKVASSTLSENYSPKGNCAGLWLVP